jgi:hypothetical protein
MELSLKDLTRLAVSQASRDLSDLARSQVPTSSDGYLRAGELLSEARRLAAGADQVVRLAVAFERARGTSWQEIGDELGASRQAAHERYAPIVDEIHEGILFPWRDGDGVTPGWWACPDGLDDPAATSRRLDGWVVRHREPSDPDHGENPVSRALAAREDREALDALGRTIDLADRLINRTLPEGVSERTGRRLLLEAKVRAYDAIAERASGARRRDAVQQSTEAFEQLVAWHRADVRERLGHISYDVGETFITLDGRAVRLLTRSLDFVDEDARGWYLWSLGDQSNTQPLPSPQLPAALIAKAVAGAGGAGGDFLADADVDVNAASAQALDLVCDYIATDAAKGFAPFGPGGIAGPPLPSIT